MSLYSELVEIYPELANLDISPSGLICLRNDSDGLGDYIEKWDFEKPIPAGYKLGK